MAFRTREEHVGRAALAAGRDLLMAAIEDRPYDLAAQVGGPQANWSTSICLGPSTAHIVEAATERRIPSYPPHRRQPGPAGPRRAQRRIWTAETDRTSAIAESIASDKDLTKSLLQSCGVPVPEGRLVDERRAAWEEAQDIGLPVVVKPYDGNHGRGVSLNLMTQADVEAAYHLAARKGDSASVLVERYITGDEHRLLVVGKRSRRRRQGRIAVGHRRRRLQHHQAGRRADQHRSAPRHRRRRAAQCAGWKKAPRSSSSWNARA
jgi:cyanophycin synthetase